MVWVDQGEDEYPLIRCDICGEIKDCCKVCHVCYECEVKRNDIL